MATPLADALDRIAALCQASFENVVNVRREERPSVAFIELQGDFGAHQVHLREIHRTDGGRRYAYYVLSGTQVIAGFDNASDPRALRLKYGTEYASHRTELIPHLHSQGKATLELTTEMDCDAFVAWLAEHLGRHE
jgi:hypothetical protein